MAPERAEKYDLLPDVSTIESPPEPDLPLSVIIPPMRLPALLLSALLLTSGCANICDRMCVSEADLYERCLPVWNTTWEESGFADRDDYLDRCYVIARGDLDLTEPGSQQRQDLKQECTSQLQKSASDTDCQTLMN